ncbi:MAG: MotA/TolQ/ExbB proton channel family protein, partial [Verrucomicrobia bacterium]|nr:MotA/TolQ/ExbB proton channel family protein [Verrucomicrobiota bacterium]
LAAALPGFIKFFAQGGFFMAVLVILSIFSLAVILQRALVIKMDRALPPDILRSVAIFKEGSSIESLQKSLSLEPSPLSRVLLSVIQHKDWPRAEILEAVQTRARHEISRLESGLVFLEITTGISPLLGLLGTLSGLVGIFGNIGAHGDPQMVANGISEALNCTIVGLGVAVPNLIAYNYFTRRVEVIAIDLESLTTDLMAKLAIGRK